MPHRPRFHLIVIPHRGDKVKTFRFPLLIIIIFFAIIFFLIGFFIHNVSNYTDITMLKVVQADNKKMISHIDTLQTQIGEIKQNIANLKNAQEKVAKLANIKLYNSGEMQNADITVDNMSEETRNIENIISTAVEKLSTGKIPARYIPSILPVNGYIVREFGKIKDLFTGKVKQHNGINIIAPLKTPVVATADGYVKEIDRDRFRGIYVILFHNKFYQTMYCHLLRKTVKKNKYVSRGDTIGYVGKTGETEFPNLYYEVRIKNKPVNPVNFLFTRK